MGLMDRLKSQDEGSEVEAKRLELFESFQTECEEAVLREFDYEEVPEFEEEHEEKTYFRQKLTEASHKVLKKHSTRFASLKRREIDNILQVALDNMTGFGPLQQLIDSDGVSEIMVNGPNQVFVERKGKLVLSDVKFKDDAQVQHVIKKIVSPLGRRCDQSQPLVDARLPDGSRVNAVIPPIALNGSTITIRKFSEDPFKIPDLVGFGTLTESMAAFLQACVSIHLNIVVSGGTGSGKTTTLNALSGMIDQGERIITVEDAAELQLQQPHVVPLETRPPNLEGKGAVTIRDLIKNCLRMRPERIIVGECRGGETLDMLQAMNTGHDGSLTTGHSNSPYDMVKRLETMVMMAGMDLPSSVIREQIGSAVHLVVQQNRLHDGSRKITHITEVNGIGPNGQVVLRDIFRWRQHGVDPETHKIHGALVPTGNIPTFLLKFRENGIEVPSDMFGEGINVHDELDRLEKEYFDKQEKERARIRAIVAEQKAELEAMKAANPERFVGHDGPPFRWSEVINRNAELVAQFKAIREGPKEEGPKSGLMGRLSRHNEPGDPKKNEEEQAEAERKLRNQIIDKLALAAKFEGIEKIEDEDRREEAYIQKIEQITRQVLSQKTDRLNQREFREICDKIQAEVMGFGALQELLDDEAVSEIMVNGPKQIFVEKSGKLQLSHVTFPDDGAVRHVIQKIVSPLGRRCDESSPLVDARLPDGSRVNAVIPPIALNGSTITIRRFAKEPLTVDKLVGFGSMTPEMAEFIKACIEIHLNIVVSGGTGSGKTTTLNAISGFIEPGERIITVEDAAELQLQQEHVVPLETRPPNSEGKGAVTIRDLIKNCLRMRPERVIVGECRGGESLDMLQAMNTGHDGSLTTGHANTPKDMVSRLETMVMMAGMDLPSSVIREQIGSAVHLVIQQNRLHDGSRKITHITEVVGTTPDGKVRLENIFEWKQYGIDDNHKIIGALVPTGYMPTFMLKFKENNIPLPGNLFGDTLDVNQEMERLEREYFEKQDKEREVIRKTVELQKIQLEKERAANPEKFVSLDLPPFRWKETIDRNRAMIEARIQKEEPADDGRKKGLLGALARKAGGNVSANSKEQWDELKKAIRKAVMDRISEDTAYGDGYEETGDEEHDRAELRKVIQRHFESLKGPKRWSLSRTQERELYDEMIASMLGFGALQPLLDDSSISEIMVNGPKQIYVEKKGKLVLSDVKFKDDAEVMHVIQKIIAPLGRRCDLSCPLVDARLPDGSRVNAIIPPLALNGPTITIRRFSEDPFTMWDLVGFGTLTDAMANFIKACVEIHLNIVVSGGTGSGKTTTLNAVSGFIHAGERIITVEDAAELQLQQEHVVPLETRPPNVEGKGAITIRDLIKNCLRMRPERIIVGECRGGEALDMLQAMNTGHDGSLTTGHANAPKDMVSRLETMVMMAGMDMPSAAIREQIANAVHLIIQQNRLHDGSRKITHLTEVAGIREDGKVNLVDIFRWEQYGEDENHKIIGALVPTGNIPSFMLRFKECGIELPPDTFGPNVDIPSTYVRLEKEAIEAQAAELRWQQERARRRELGLKSDEKKFSFEKQSEEADKKAALLDQIDEETSFEEFQRIKRQEVARQLTADAGRSEGQAGHDLDEDFSEDDIIRAASLHADKVASTGGGKLQGAGIALPPAPPRPGAGAAPPLPAPPARPPAPAAKPAPAPAPALAPAPAPTSARPPAPAPSPPLPRPTSTPGGQAPPPARPPSSAGGLLGARLASTPGAPGVASPRPAPLPPAPAPARPAPAIPLAPPARPSSGPGQAAPPPPSSPSPASAPSQPSQSSGGQSADDSSGGTPLRGKSLLDRLRKK